MRWILWMTLATLPAMAGSGITKISPAIYQNSRMMSFLADYLMLTEAQMVLSDLAFAEARAKMFPLNEKLKHVQAALDQALSDGAAAAQWKPMITSIAATQAQILAIECGALEKFRNLLDGDQRHKLSKLSQVSMIKNEQGKPVLAYSVER